jgi:hypothetical protein
MTPEIKFYASKKKMLFMLLISVIFVAAGIFILTKSENAEDTTTGWSCIGFFGVCGAFFIYSLFSKTPKLILNEEGIGGQNLGKQFIPWAHIHGIDTLDIGIHGSQKFITLILDEGYVETLKMGKTGKKLSAWVINNIGFSVLVDSLNISRKDLVVLIQSIIDNKMRIKETILLYLSQNEP